MGPVAQFPEEDHGIPHNHAQVITKFVDGEAPIKRRYEITEVIGQRGDYFKVCSWATTSLPQSDFSNADALLHECYHGETPDPELPKKETRTPVESEEVRQLSIRLASYDKTLEEKRKEWITAHNDPPLQVRVNNLPEGYTREDIYNLFHQCGRIINIDSFHKTYAVVEFLDPPSFEAALAMDHMIFKEHQLTVSALDKTIYLKCMEQVQRGKRRN